MIKLKQHEDNTKLIKDLHKKIGEIKEDDTDYEYLKIFIKNRIDFYNTKLENFKTTTNNGIAMTGISISILAMGVSLISIIITFFDSNFDSNTSSDISYLISFFESLRWVFIISLTAGVGGMLWSVLSTYIFTRNNSKKFLFYKVCLNIIDSLS